MEITASALNTNTNVESLMVNIESTRTARSKFHIDTKILNASESTADDGILNKFKIGILKTAKDNNVLNDLHKFFHKVLLVENWTNAIQEDTDDSDDGDYCTSGEEDLSPNKDDISDKGTRMLDDRKGAAVRDNSCNKAIKFDNNTSEDVEREKVGNNCIDRRTVEKEHLELLNKQHVGGNRVKQLTDHDMEEIILAADESTICKLPFAALAKMRSDILRICFQSDVDMNVFVEPRGRNLLMYAVSLPSLEICTLDLLLDKLNIQTRNSLHKTSALTECLVNSKMDSDMKITIVRKCLDAGITLECSGRFYSSPLHIYIDAIISYNYKNLEVNWKDIINELVKAGNDVNSLNFEGRTPLMNIAEMITQDDIEIPETVQINERIISIADYLLQKGADPDMRDLYGKSSIFFAVLTRNLKILNMLLKYCKNANIQDNMGMTAIYRACAFIEGPYDDGDIDYVIVPMLDALATSGCSINLQAVDMTTALHHSAVKQPHRICEKLCALGADTNKRDYLKRTPLHLAARNEDAKLIKVLLKYGADINARDLNSETPLHHACIFGNTDTAKMLVRAGANVEAQSVLGIRPVHLAAEQGDRNIIEYMMSIADHSTTDIYGAQVIHYAAADGNTETIEYLLHIGIDEQQRDMSGMNALDLARYMGHLESAQLLHGSESVQFGNLPPGCFPNGHLLLITQVDDYYKNMSDKFTKETINQKPKAVETARGLLTSKGLGSVKFGKEDGQLILDLIVTYANALARRIGELDPLFQCTILRAGSTFEGVKTGYPDEFDFLCDLTALRQHVEHFEQGDTEGFARVLLKEENAPDTVNRFRIGTSRYLSSTRIFRHFSKLALRAKFDVLSQANFKGHIYSGVSLLPEIIPIFTGNYLNLSHLNSQTLSFRGLQHKHLFIDIDLNPVLFSKNYPDEANDKCRLLPNVSSRGIYVIPKLCDVLGLKSEDNTHPEEEHWRFSTQHIEAEVMQQMPQIALDGYMVCKLFRMEPLACSVKYLEHDGACLSKEQLRKLLPHGTAMQVEDESESDSTASDDGSQAEEDAYAYDMNSMQNTAASNKTYIEDDVFKNVVENIETDVEDEANVGETDFKNFKQNVTEHMDKIFKRDIIHTRLCEKIKNNDKTISYQTIKDEYESGLADENVVELTAEKAIPSYYIKSIFIKEMERMACDGEELSEESIVKIPRSVYEQLLTALKESNLTTLFMPHHNILKKRHAEDLKVKEMREKYCKNILRLMDSLGFH